MSNSESDKLTVVKDGSQSEYLPLQWSRRFDLFGVQVSAITYDAAEREILAAAKRNEAAVVSHHDVRALMDASREADLREAANSFQVIAPDGQPIRWALNALYGAGLPDPITGTDLMRRLCERAAREGVSVYLYGSTPEVIVSLQAALTERYPGLRLAGAESPPFRTLSPEEDRETVQRINQSGAGIVFVALGYPKQDRFAYEHRHRIHAVQICVGAAFDFLSGKEDQGAALDATDGTRMVIQAGQGTASPLATVLSREHDLPGEVRVCSASALRSHASQSRAVSRVERTVLGPPRICWSRAKMIPVSLKTRSSSGGEKAVAAKLTERPKMIRLKSLAKGIGSFAVPALRASHREGGTISAMHCYALFLRLYSFVMPNLQDRGMPFPSRVAELGPGSSVGMGIAALLCGADSYVGLDLVNHLDTGRNLEILDELVDLFRRRTESPYTGSYTEVFPWPQCNGFPDELNECLPQTLRAERVEKIREDLREHGGSVVRIVAPWTDEFNLEAESVDWLWSHSVMEHVDAFEETYAFMHRWLSPGGIATHLVDFWSHNLTSDWNGHWAVGDTMWTLVRGRRPYLLNRLSRSQHLEILRKTGFEILSEKRATRRDGLDPTRFARPFRHISKEDSQTRMTFVVTRKPDPVRSIGDKRSEGDCPVVAVPTESKP